MIGKQLDAFLDPIARRDDGMARATNHATAVTPRWADTAYEFLQDYSALNFQPFLTEDVVLASEGQVPEPPDRRAWGSIMAKGARRGIIRREGWATDKFMSPKPLWRTTKRPPW
jgi:hypothetical protein